MRGQCTKSARARKRGDHAHTCSTLWLGVPRIFLIAPLSYDAVAFYLNRGEQRLRYEKLAISSTIDTSSKPAPAASRASSRLNSNASCSVIFSVSSNASRVGSWQLTPGTSAIHPIHHGPDCLIMAV